METVWRKGGAPVGCCLWKTALLLLLWRGKGCKCGRQTCCRLENTVVYMREQFHIIRAKNSCGALRFIKISATKGGFIVMGCKSGTSHPLSVCLFPFLHLLLRCHSVLAKEIATFCSHTALWVSVYSAHRVYYNRLCASCGLFGAFTWRSGRE